MVKGRHSRRAEDEAPDVSSPGPARPEAQIPPDERISRIKELIQVFIKQVEALGHRCKARDRISIREEVERFESDLIRHALALTGGHQRRAARLLGVKATTLNEKIKRYKIRPARLTVVGDADTPDA